MPQYFRPYRREAVDAAAAAGLETPYFQPRDRRDDDLVRTTVWRSRDLTVPLAEVSGHWTVYLSYDFQNLPGERDLRLVGTSFGLNVHEVPFTSEEPVTLLRYDYDLLLGPAQQDEPSVNVHINVLQPDPLRDGIHFPAFRTDPWTVKDVMRWMTSRRLLADLQRRLPA